MTNYDWLREELDSSERRVFDWAIKFYFMNKKRYAIYSVEEALSLSIRELGGVYVTPTEFSVLSEKIELYIEKNKEELSRKF